MRNWTNKWLNERPIGVSERKTIAAWWARVVWNEILYFSIVSIYFTMKHALKRQRNFF